MAIGTGVAHLFGVKKATTWGTSVAVGASNAGFRPVQGSWSVDETPEPQPDKSFNADALDRARTFTGRYLIRGTYAVEAKYDGLDTQLALFFGTAGVPTGAGPYTHTLYRKNDMTGIFFSLVWFDGIKYHEVDSCKYDGLKVTASAGRVLRYEFSWFGRKRAEDTATNPNLSSLTENSTIAEVQWRNSVIAYQAAAFASSLAAITPTDWDLSYARPYDIDRSYVSEYINEPMAGEMTVTGSVTIPHEATTWITAATSGAQYKAKFDHVSGSLQHGHWLPSVTFVKPEWNPQDKAGVQQKLTFRAEKAASTPSTYSQAVPYAQLVNNNSANPLA